MNTNFVFTAVLGLIGICCNSACTSSHANEPAGMDSQVPEIPCIHSIGMNEFQPQEHDSAVIWYDDFKNEKTYMDSFGVIDYAESFDMTGGSMKAGFKKGDIDGAGNRKVTFGDFPGGSTTMKKGRRFDEVYWRIYVKHEYGWQGAPAKMSRATSIVSENWQQAMITHVWSGEKNSITLDPASGVKGQTDSIITTKYNDFDHLRWLGGTPCSAFQISSAYESGYWVMVEATAKLNTPGKSDGSCQLWIDGRLEAERKNLNFRGTYTKHGINAVFLESYWNSGAVKTEEMWYDNFVVSTNPIGPVTCPVNPVLYKTPYHGPGKQKAWEVELASDFSGTDVVYQSGNQGIKNSVIINLENGSFTGSLQGNSHLTSGIIYFCRVRQKSDNGQWSLWSRWHQPFKASENNNFKKTAN